MMRRPPREKSGLGKAGNRRGSAEQETLVQMSPSNRRRRIGPRGPDPGRALLWPPPSLRCDDGDFVPLWHRTLPFASGKLTHSPAGDSMFLQVGS
ncbi:hypothetical protein MRX96_030773 [Rhipicephalus microplus]